MAFVVPIATSTFTQRFRPAVSHRRPASLTRMSAVPNVPDVLKKILERKETEVANLRAEVEAAGASHPVAQVLSKKGSSPRGKAFYSALKLPPGTLTVIAEVKRRSPSKGKIGDVKDPGLLSRVYYEAGANAISVLTDLEGFGGTLDDLKQVVETQSTFKGNYPEPCPVLRKDFTIDEIQIAEAAAAGASAVLLIVAALGKEKTKELLDATHAFGLDALVEVHDEDELKIALDAGAEIVGVNNRDLRTFDVSLDTAMRLVELIPEHVVKIAESGIAQYIDAWRLRDVGYNAVLVGESLVRAYEGSASDNTSYTASYNQAKGLIKAFKAKGSVEFGSSTSFSFYGKGEAAKETLGEMSI